MGKSAIPGGHFEYFAQSWASILSGNQIVKLRKKRLEDYDGSFWFIQRIGYAKAGGSEETGFL